MGLCTTLDLFSGCCGFELGLRLSGVETFTACYVERDSYSQGIIQDRIKEGLLDDAPIWDDITTFDGRPWRGHVDLITAGFPCQPHSHAGKRLGKKDSRNLWPDTLRVICEVGSEYVLLENVRALVDGKDPFAAEVIGGLSEAGYDAIWGLFSAAQAGAPHLRERWWCLAYTNTVHDGFHKTEVGTPEQDCDQPKERLSVRDVPWWGTEPGICGVADGVADWVDRIRTGGNGLVPAVVREFLTG
jgi:DNA (cytosine-5)-methyltransferase 1